MLRNSCEREGLTTFTVVPQQSRRCFEVSQQTSELKLSTGAREHLDNHTKEPAEDDVQTELFTNDGNAVEKPENPAEILQHSERKNQTWTERKTDDEQSIHLNNLKKAFQTGLKTRKPLDSKMKDTLASDDSERQEHAPVETSKEKNWIDEYKERRRTFLGGDDDDDDGKRNVDAWGKIKRKFLISQMEVDDHFPSPPPPVCWSENSDGEDQSEQMDTATDAQTRNRWPNDERHFDQDEALGYSQKPKAHSNQTNPEPDHSSDPEPPERVSRSCSDDCSPERTSLFALAVFQKAKHCRPGMDAKHSKR